MKHPQASSVVYTVSWEAVAEDADANRGVSALQVSALDTTSGKLLWREAPANVSSLYQSSIQEVIDGVLYIAGTGSHSTLVLAVDTRDGHAIWQQTEKEGVWAIRRCADTVYLKIGHVEIVALHAANGQVRWRYKEEVYVSEDFVVTTQAVYLLKWQPTGLGRMSPSVIALDAEQGNVLWSQPSDHPQGSSFSLVANGPAVSLITQVQSSSSSDPMRAPVSRVQALDGASGQALWQAQMPPDVGPIKVLSVGATIYLNGRDLLKQDQSLLMALSASDGKQLWLCRHPFDQLTVLGTQDLYGYQGYAPGADPQGKKRLCLLDGSMGKERWCVDSLKPSLFSLSATGEIVIVEETIQPGPLTLIQNLYGIRKHDGTILWKLPWKSSSPSVQTLTLVTVLEQQSLRKIAV